MSYRKCQAIFDLRSAACHLLSEVSRDLSPHETSLKDALAKFSINPISLWNLNLSDDEWQTLRHQCWSSHETPADGLFATCVLLLDRFENPHRNGDLEWEWDEFCDSYRAAPNPIRSALMNGFEIARQNSVISQAIRPSSTDLATQPEARVIQPLIDLAQRMTAEERAFVSKVDHGNDIEKHHQALDALLATNHCRFPDTWFPAEVVELISHSPNPRGFVGFTALVLINAIYDDDGYGHASCRWAQNKDAYQKLAPEERSSFLMAFRHLYETVPNWSAFSEAPRPKKKDAKPRRLCSTDCIPWSPNAFDERVVAP